LSKCAAIKANGERCKGGAMPGSEWCYNHNPAYADERRRHGHKGGRLGGRGRPRVEISSIKVQLQELADGVLDGSIDRADGATVSQILNVLLRAITTEMQLREQTEFEERLDSLEEKLAHRQDRHGA
jgi:hypothetical protein